MKHAYLLYTGYGKTKLVLDKIMNAKASRKPRTLLISTAKIVESSWSAEIDKWYPGQLTYSYITGKIPPKKRPTILNNPTDILGINTEMLDWYISNTCPIKSYRQKKDKEGNRYKEPVYDTTVIAKRFDLIVFDESSLFKSYSSSRFDNVKRFASITPNVIILSATPTPKNIEDLWSQIYLLDGGARLGKNITAFRNTYGTPIPMFNGMTRWEYTAAATDAVLLKVKDIVTSIPVPPAPLFPEPVVKNTIIKPDEATANILRTFKEKYVVQLDNGIKVTANTINQMINKMSQFASGDVYMYHMTHHVNDVKFEYLKYLLTQINTPVLITYVYKFDLAKLLTLPGAKLLETAQDHKDWNANKISIGILSPFSSAHGLNLQDSDCQNIIWFSPIWDTEKWIQTNARVCRRGQKHQVTIRVLTLKGSYDQYMFDTCIDKYKVQYNNLVKLS